MENEIVIGGLKIRLVLEDLTAAGVAASSRNLSHLEGDTSRLSRAFERMGKRIGIAIAAVTAAVGLAIKGAINHADEIGKASQRIGITTEALSRLEYAAKLSDVSFEALQTSAARFNRNIADAAKGTGEANAAFQALQINLKDNEGNLRSTEELILEVADRFSRMEDGAAKTSLAMQLFGRTGADLIPMLNEGREGLAAMADESDRLGNTISAKTAAAAEEANDRITRLQVALQGIATRVIEAALPALEKLTNALTDPKFQKAASDFFGVVVNVITAIVDGTANAANNIRMLRDLMSGLEDKSTQGLEDELVQLGAQRVQVENELLQIQSKMREGVRNIGRDMLSDLVVELEGQLTALTEQEARIIEVLKGRNVIGTGPVGEDGDKPGSTDPEDPPFTPTILGPTEEELEAQLQKLRDYLSTEEELETSQYERRLEELAEFLEREMITKAEYDELYAKAEQDHWDNIKEIRKKNMSDLEEFTAKSYMDQAKTIFGELESITAGVAEHNDALFAINKAAGVANAIINAYEGISKSLASYPMPLAAIMAGVHAAAGFAQVSALLSTTKDSKSVRNTVSSSGGSAVPATATGTDAAAPGVSREMIVKGIDRNSLFGGDAVRVIADELLKFQRDGGQVVFK